MVRARRRRSRPIRINQSLRITHARAVVVQSSNQRDNASSASCFRVAPRSLEAPGRSAGTLRELEQAAQSSPFAAIEPAASQALEGETALGGLAAFERVEALEERREANQRRSELEPAEDGNLVGVQAFERRAQARNVPPRPGLDRDAGLASRLVVGRIDPPFDVLASRSEEAQPFGMIGGAVASASHREAEARVRTDGGEELRDHHRRLRDPPRAFPPFLSKFVPSVSAGSGRAAEEQ